MAQAGVAYVTIKPDWQGFNRDLKRTAPNLNREFASMGGQIGRSFAGLGKQAGVAFARSASTAAKVGAVGIGASLIGAVKVAGDFEQQLSSLGSVSDASAKQMDALRDAAVKAGAATKFSALDAAKAQTELAKGGLSTSQILKGGLNSALALAAAGELDLADAAATTVNAMKLFGIRGKDSIGVADALATAANSTTADVSDFALALSQAGSAAKTVGLSFPETITALETLAEVGVKGSDAGTSLKTALVQLASPTSDKAVEMARKLGINIFDSTGKIKPLVEVSKELRDGLGGLTEQQRIQAATTLVGQDGFRALLALYEAGPTKIAKLERELGKQGSAADVAKKKQDNLKGSLEQLGGSFETLGVNVGTLMIPAVRRGADALTDFANDIGEIAADDKLDLGEKLSKSFEVAKVDAAPWVAKLKASIIRADIPGEIGDLLTRGSDRIGDGFDGGDFVDQIIDQIEAADLPEKFGDLVSEITPKVIAAFAGAGVLSAGAFVKAFTSADAWGKVALGAFLLSKMGGVSAFRALGAKTGVGFGTSFAASSAASAAAAGVPGLVGAPVGKGRPGTPTGKSGLAAGSPLGAAGTGLTSGSPLAAGGAKNLTAGPGRLARGAGAAGTFALGAVGGPVGLAVASGIALAILEADKRARDAEKISGTLKRVNSELASAIPDPARWKATSDAVDILNQRFSGSIEEYRDASGALDRLGLSLDSKPEEVAKATGAFKGLEDKFKVTQALFKRGITLSPEVTTESAIAVETAIARMSRGAASSIGNLRTNVRLNSRLIARSLGDDTAEGKEALAANFRSATENIKRSMEAGTISTKQGTAEIERLMVAALSQFGFSKKQALNIAKTGDPDANKGREGGASSVIKRQRGGPISGGKPSGDSIPALLERGEYVLNREAVKHVGVGKLDAINFGAASRFQTGGMVAAANRVEKEHFPYVWGGGHQSTPAPLVPFDCSGVVSYILQQGGIDIPTMTSGQMMNLGKAGPGPVTIFASPEHVLMRIGSRYFGTSGSNPGGGAGWIDPAPSADYLERFTQRHFDGGIAAEKLKRVLVGGPDSLLKSMVQGAVDTTRAAAQAAVDRTVGQMGVGLGQAGDGGADFTASGNGADLMKQIAKQRGWNFADWWALDAKETGHGTNLSNPTSTARLRGQFLDSNYGKYGPGSDPRQNPSMGQQIQAMADYIGERYGNPSKALAFHNAHNFYQRGGIVGALARFASGGIADRRSDGTPIKGLAAAAPGVGDFGKALSQIKTGKTEKIRGAAAQQLVDSIQGIGFPEQAMTLSRLEGDSNLFGEYADRAGQLTDSGKIQEALEGELKRRQGLSPLPAPLFPGDAQQGIVDQLLGRVGGFTQLDWLTRQLGSLFDWRNVIADTGPIVDRLKAQTDGLLEDARKRLEAVVAQIAVADKEIKRLERERDKVRDRRETVARRIEDENDKPAKKRDAKKLARLRNEASGLQARHREINQELGVLRGEQRSGEALRVGLTEQVIPALEDKSGALADGKGNLLGSLVDIQGLGGPLDRLGSLPPIGVMGGKLFDVQSLIKDLTDNPPRVEATVPEKSTPAAFTTGQLLDVLKLSKALVTGGEKLGLSSEQIALKGNDDLPFAGSFDTGGPIPGPVGKPYAAIVHGGEHVLTAEEARAGVGSDTIVKVYVDGQEFRGLVRTEIRERERTTRGTYRAGVA